MSDIRIERLVIPANAGVILVGDVWTAYAGGYPRECGGDPTSTILGKSK